MYPETLKSLRVSAIFITFNQEKYVFEALSSLFNQTYPYFEIVISDDCSTDNTYQILEKMVSEYSGPHRVILNRTSENLGIGRNTQAAIDLADADIYVTCDGDDISVIDRIQKLVNFFESNDSKFNLVVSDAFSMTQEGIVLGVKPSDELQHITSVDELLKSPPLFYGTTTAFRRSIVSEFGKIKEGVSAVDQIVLFRSILIGAACTIHHPLVYHRLGGITGFQAINVYDKINRLKKDACRTISDLSQKLEDASLKNYLGPVDAEFSQNLAIAKYILNILNASSFLEKMAIFVKSKGVPLTKKIRFLSYATIAPLLNFLWFFKRGICR